ncbi:NADP-dependent 3-hydroxy acid dehydrogenase YdfG [Conyzicola lurida]|uniref:NADP-dependent 3-hydroxy acid dehydrogenase YdfG n=1 Tax=Conyzicola lurida TaxID=1172621 RepID=A0A841AH26_9MICO|nr:SDR family oxidoreductase [Conyzicola lurida]MBB5841714.1 NADP-dependent 3-hydroxy acid dehydrogenase YdfG [Conyzicola lurida]
MTSTPSNTAGAVLITGASSGIGEATARHLGALGYPVVLGARRVDKLAAVVDDIREAGGRAEFHELDVTDLASVRDFVAFATTVYGRVDVLVNNAGVMPLSTMNALRIDEWNQMIDVNLRGTLHGIAAVLPLMEAQGSGHIVNVASVSGLRVDPTAAVYSATKFAVRALSEGLRQESRVVRVTIVSPGFTVSELTERGGDVATLDAVRATTAQMGLPASAVAEAIAYAIGQPATVDVNEIIVRPTLQG